MKELFGIMPDGREVYAHTVSAGDLSLTVIDYAAAIQKFVHKGTDIVCGFDTLDGYRKGGGNQGASIGRYANRISGGKITLDGVDYPLERNNGVAHLHGGSHGFNTKVWDVTEGVCKCGAPTLTCTYVSEDGEAGYPGRLEVTVTYKLKPEGLLIDYKATTDKPTYCNLTNHSYFNLHGQDCTSCLDHVLKINADNYTDADPKTLLPTGKRPDVTGTAFDFRTPKAIGKDIDKTGLGYAGYDHNFILNGKETALFGKHELKVAAVCSVPERTMTVLTTMPGIQIYTGNFLGDNPNNFKGGVPQTKHAAVCFETQYEPDSPSHGEARLDPGQVYHHITVFKLN
ncbi:MAG: galactose mutarotase [Clostridia bacterium]|nr:galactose mutarotase [Clostridia bacterium]